jgi:hypothetical protein
MRLPVADSAQPQRLTGEFWPLTSEVEHLI